MGWEFSGTHQPGVADLNRTKIVSVFAELGLKITDFLDVTLNLSTKKYTSYRKPNDRPMYMYIHKRSNHPPTIIKNLPASISRRLTDISSDEQAFSDASPLYANALKESGYSEGLQYLAHRKTEVKDSKRKRQRKVIWFNPPCSRNVKTNIGGNFLRLVDKYFLKGSTLHKIFNRNNLKVSYSCMQNLATVISQHNNKVRRNQQQGRSDRGEARKCNCRIKDQCPLEGECLTNNVVHKAVVTSGNNRKIYTGLTANSFKQRYYNHQQSMRHKEYETSTTLSKYIWTL